MWFLHVVIRPCWDGDLCSVLDPECGTRGEFYVGCFGEWEVARAL